MELQNVTKFFGDFVAVENVSLQIETGEFFSLLGPSGCGKTTCLRMIAGFELLTEGEISIRGQPMVDIPPYKRPVNTVFQNYALFPHMTIAENLAFPLKVRKLDSETIESKVQSALDMVELGHVASRYPAFRRINEFFNDAGPGALRRACRVLGNND